MLTKLAVLLKNEAIYGHAYLVENVLAGIRQCDSLGEDAAFFVKLVGMAAPVVKSASHVDSVGGMFPI